MNPVDALEKFKTSVKVGITWAKKEGMKVVFENSEDMTFYFIQGQFLYFNQSRRLVGILPAVYKHLDPGQVLFDHFNSDEAKITKNVYTIVFLPSSVEINNPYTSTSMEEREVKLSELEAENPYIPKTKNVFDTDFVRLPEVSD